MHLVYRRSRPGDLLFNEGDPADRLFILEEGGVTLVDAAHRPLPSRYEAGDGVGVRSFLAGVRHTVSARVLRECGAWTLRRKDFEQLIAHYPDIRHRLAAYLQGPGIRDYLSERYHLDGGKVIDDGPVRPRVFSLPGGAGSRSDAHNDRPDHAAGGLHQGRFHCWLLHPDGFFLRDIHQGAVSGQKPQARSAHPAATN